MKQLGMFDDQVECMEDPIKEGSGEGEGDGVRGVECATVGVGVEALSTTVPQPAPVQRKEEEEGNAETVRNDGGSHERSSEDMEPASEKIGKMCRCQPQPLQM